MAAQRRRDTRFFFLPGEQGNDVALFASVRNRDGTSRAAACKSFTRVCVIANELERGYMPCRLDVGRNVFTRGIRSIGTTSILLSAICIYVRIYGRPSPSGWAPSSPPSSLSRIIRDKLRDIFRDRFRLTESKDSGTERDIWLESDEIVSNVLTRCTRVESRLFILD